MTASPRSRSGVRSPASSFWTFIAILGLALALRLLLIAIKSKGYYFADTAEYDAAARAMLSGQVTAATDLRAPAYPAFMALVYRVAGEGNYPAVRWTQLVLGLSVVGLVALLGRRMGRAGVGSLAALGAALAPTLVFTTTMLYPSVLFTVLLLVAVLLAREIRETPRLAAGAALGVVFAVACLTDFMFIGPLAGILGWLLWGARSAGRRLVAAASVAVLVLAVSLGSWWAVRPHSNVPLRSPLAKAEYVLYIARHEPGIVGGHQVQVPSEGSFHPLSPGAFLKREARLLREQPGAYLHDVGFEFVHFWSPMPDRIQTVNEATGSFGRGLVTIYFLPVLLFAVFGLWGGVAARDRALLLIVPVSTAALYALFFTQMRYRIPTEPFLLLLSALGVQKVWSSLRSRAPAGAELVTQDPTASRTGA